MPRPKKGSPEAKAWAAKMKAARLAKAAPVAPVEEPVVPQLDPTDHIAPEQGLDELRAQMQELMKTQNAILRDALGKKEGTTDREGVVIVDFERYSLDPKNYPDPTERLAKESRLVAVNFLYNYELEYTVSRSRYQTVTGRWMVEPKFLIQLNKIKLNDQGEQTPERYIARRLIFHEDPDAAMVVASEAGLEIDRTNQVDFLNEMRYLRVRDWLFDIFWPKPVQPEAGVREEVIGGTIVQVFTKSSEDPSEIDFDKLKTKVQA